MLQSFNFLIIEQIEEQNIADNLLRIFRACIPSMTKAALKFGQELQTSLQLMIVKPSSAGGLQVILGIPFQIFLLTYLFQTMQEAIACFCVVVNHLTHDYTRAIGLLKSCLSEVL
jgi:cohesin loading factor subunit SCC2